MKTNFKFCLAALLFAGIGSNAQTITATAAGSVGSSGTIAAGTSVQVGAGAGNGASSTGGSNVSVGYLAGDNLTSAAGNTFIGSLAGSATTTGANNTFLGNTAGASNTTGYSNTIIGYYAGAGNTTGVENVFIGAGTAAATGNASYNTFIGNAVGSSLVGGSGNILIGHGAGNAFTNVYGNVCVGMAAGQNASGEYNVFLGNGAGRYETSSNKLYLENTTTSTPLVWGDFNADQLKFHAKVGIGGNSSTSFGTFTSGAIFPSTASSVSVSNYNLFVKGGILTEEVRISSFGTWADYVFEKNYDLKPLSEVEKYIEQNGHLPNVPSAKQIKDEGFELAEMAKIQQEKIEELTLYLIQQQKEIEALKAQVNALANHK